MNFLITEYKPEFDSKVSDIILAALESVGIGADKYPQIWEEITPDYIAARYTGRSRFWVALRDGEPVGTIAVNDRGWDMAEIKRMFVAPSVQKMGVGQKLLDTAIAFARSEGYTKMYLETDGLMKGAHRFYEKNGFKVLKEYGDWQSYEYVLQVQR